MPKFEAESNSHVFHSFNPNTVLKVLFGETNGCNHEAILLNFNKISV